MSRFTVPDFFPDFHCKGGTCRHNCCLGWRVTMSLTDYFRLVGLDCSPELRRKLDTALHVFPRPTPERYAELACNWEGLCPMLLPDGLCSLQAECGEASLSATCRYHPRGVRTAFGNQATVSASCEALAEMLFTREAPLTLTSAELTFDLPLLAPELTGKAADAACRERDRVIGILTDRSQRLSERLQSLTGEPQPSQLSTLTETLLGDTASAGEDCARAALRLGDDEALFANAMAELCARFPSLDHFLEHLLVNHLIYTDYPMDADCPDAPAQLRALSAIYWSLCYILAGSQPLTSSDLIDRCTDCFRVYEHSPFSRRFQEYRP